MAAELHPSSLLTGAETRVAVRSMIHELADSYEQWLTLQQLAEQVSGDPTREGDRPLLRKAYALGQRAEAELVELRRKLSAFRSIDLGELARKARIVRFDASSWLDEGDDPLFTSFCDDALRLAGTDTIAEPYPVPPEAFERLAKLDIDAPPTPWEDQL